MAHCKWAYPTTGEITLAFKNQMNTIYETPETTKMIFDSMKVSFRVGPNAHPDLLGDLECKKEYFKLHRQDATLDVAPLLEGLTSVMKSLSADDFMIKCIESAIVFVAQLARSQNAGDIMLALTALLQSTRTKSLTSGLAQLTSRVYADIFVTTFVPQSSGFEHLSEFADFLDNIRSNIDFSIHLSRSPVMRKLHKFLLFCLSSSFCENLGLSLDDLGYDEFEAAAIKKAHSGKKNFLWCLFDASSTFLSQFCKSVKMGSWEGFFHSESTYETFVDNVMDLKNKSKFLTNPEAHGFDLFSYRALLAKTYDHGVIIAKRFAGSGDSFEKNAIKKMLAEINLLRSQDISKTSAQKERAAPFGICVGGGSSLGKSTLVKYLFQYYGKLHKLPIESEHMYTRNCMEKHWNGFRSSAWCILMDDIAALSPKLGALDPSLAEIISVINNVAFVPEQAELHEKGVTPVLSELIIATTNTFNLNAHAYFSCPLAIQRRLPWVVQVHVREECGTNGQLDHSKLDIQTDKFNDWWRLKVFNVVPGAGSNPSEQRGVLKLVHDFATIEDFLAWFGKTSMDHKRVQESIRVQNLKSQEIAVCLTCCYPQYACKCAPSMENQSGEGVVSTHTPGNPYETFWSWTKQDTADLMYTLWACFRIFIAYTPLAIFGTLTMALTGYYGRFMSHLTIYDWQGAMYRFIFRRMGRRMCQSMEGVIPMIKILGTLTATSFFVGYAWNKIVPPIGVTVIPTCVCKRPLSTDDLSLKSQLNALDARLNVVKDEEKILKARIQKLCEYSALNEIVSEDINEECDNIPLASEFLVASGEGRPPSPDEEARLNVWQKKDFSVTPFDLSPSTLSSNNIPDAVFRTSIFKALRRVRMISTCGKVKVSGAFAVGGWMYAYNKHALPPGDVWTVELHREPTADGVNSTSTFSLTRNRVYFIEDSDVCFLCLTSQAPTKNLFKYFVNATWNGNEVGELLGMDQETMQYRVNPVRKIHASEYDWDNDGKMLPVYLGYSSITTVKGECGSVLWSPSQRGHIILGIHAAGNSATNHVLTMPLRQEWVMAACAHFNIPAIQSGVPKLTSKTSMPHALGPVHHKSPLMFIPQGTALVRGSFSGFRAAPVSHVKPTLLKDAASKRGYVSQGGAPNFKGWRPWHKAMSDMVGIQDIFRDDVIDACVVSFTNDILKNLTTYDLGKIHVYDLHTSINGADGVAYIDSINRSTSAGFPWNRSKRGFLIKNSDEATDTVGVDSEITEIVDEMLANYKQGITYGTIFRGTLKDEVTSHEKIAVGKLRMFSGASFPFTLVTRMYYLPLIKLLMTKRYLFESAPGTIAQSPEWDDMRSYLVHFGEDKIVAGDFKAFDKSMSAKLMMAAFRILINIAEAAGYDDEETKVMWSIASEICYPHYEINGDLVQIFGSNPSGHALTVIINGMVNCLYMRYCYTILSPLRNCNDFKEHVHLMTYGDDNIMGVSDAAPWFNHSTIQVILENHGITYTMADKLSESVAYINISDASFLKRTWRFDDDIGLFVCPLDWSSIEKSIMDCVESRSVSRDAQARAIATSAVDEFFWYGKSVFEFRRTEMENIVAESCVEDPDFKFSTWDELCERYRGYDMSLGKWRTII